MSRGCLEYPDQLRGLHNDCPLALEKLDINRGMLSKCCSNIAYQYGMKVGSVNKLAPNLGNKGIYALRYKKLYLSLGMTLIKIH